MAEVTCTKEEYKNKDGKCCDRCNAGLYMKAECDGTNPTECGKCEDGLFTATKNHLNKCHVCTICSSSNRQRKVKNCTAQEDTVCECVTGYYCDNDHCNICKKAKQCLPGEGAKVPATRTNDTICAPCEDGTFSNITNSQLRCQPHTRCEDIGKVLKIPGTRTTDAICENLTCHCDWMLPAFLWSGLALTALVLFGFIYWRKKRKSYKTVSSVIPVTITEGVSAAPDTQLDLSLPSTEKNGYCIVDGCSLPVFNPDNNAVSCSTHESTDSCIPITPLKASVSFSESTMNGSARYITGNFLRTYSEPQEDEWCGT